MNRRAGLGLAFVLLLAAGGWWAFEEARWLPLSELDQKPYPLRRIDLEPPAAERGVEYFGKLRLRIQIRASGEVERVEVVSATVPARIVEHAVNAFSAARWEPGRKSGRARRSVNTVEIDFEPPVPGLDRPISQPDG